MSRLLVLALALASLVLGAAGCGSEAETDDAAGPPAASTPSTTSGTANTPPPIVDDENEGVRGSGGGVAGGPPAVGDVVPDLAGSTLAGDSFSLSQLRGKKVIVHLWSSWWITCQTEAVAFAEFARDHPEIQFVGLNVADEDARAREFVDEHGFDWPQLIDHSRTKARRLGADYQPAFFAIDEDGRLAGTYIGYGDPENTDAWEQLASTLQ